MCSKYKIKAPKTQQKCRKNDGGKGVPKKNLLECLVCHLIRIRAGDTGAAKGAHNGDDILGTVELWCIQAHANGSKGLEAVAHILQRSVHMGFESRSARVSANCSVPLQQRLHKRHDGRIFARDGNVQHTDCRAAHNNNDK